MILCEEILYSDKCVGLVPWEKLGETSILGFWHDEESNVTTSDKSQFLNSKQ